MEVFVGIIHRVTYHNVETGWTVLKVNPLKSLHELRTVTVHQANVFAGATMEFEGEWMQHPKFGEQFKSTKVTERKPATASALEKYLGSGMIKGVGPKIAKRIVKYFGAETLDVFEHKIDRLTEVPGIAATKLQQITNSWVEHREIRNVMLFLQGYGISTLFAVKIFKQYGNDAIAIVQKNPYQLSKDIYGIGFFSADSIALNIGLEKDSPKRIRAAISHVLAASREQGHCYLELENIQLEVKKLLQQDFSDLINQEIVGMEAENELKTRVQEELKCYYSKSLYYDELNTAEKTRQFLQQKIKIELQRVNNWLERYNKGQEFPLSSEQYQSILGAVAQPFSILTGGPGCGKTTTTKALVQLLRAMKKRILLAAPTGRAAQRMSEVIGMEAQTIHRLLVWQPGSGQFQKNEETPLECDFIIIDECSMLDISLAASLLKAIPLRAQVLFIGDADQLPSVGAGNVLKDLIDSRIIPTYKLLTIFRQAQESRIIQYAHQINKGEVPKIESPIHRTTAWEEGIDCLFVDSDEASKDQLKFIQKINKTMKQVVENKNIAFVKESDETYKSVKLEEDFYIQETSEQEIEAIRRQGGRSYVFNIPDKYLKADLAALLKSPNEANALKQVLQHIHPWSSLHYGLTAAEMIVRLYTKTIPNKFSSTLETQILAPMKVGTMGTNNLNQLIQEQANPAQEDKASLEMGGRIFRVNDRVIQRRNNYDLEVFNGDIGTITMINSLDMTLTVTYQSSSETRIIEYTTQDIIDLELAYAITIHKSQGSEFDIVIIPLVLQHFNMLYRNLIYTALTRAKKMAIFVGTRKALGIAVRNIDNRQRKTMLKELLLSST